MYRTIHKKELKRLWVLGGGMPGKAWKLDERGKLVVVAGVYRRAGQRSTDSFVKKFYGQETASHGGRYRYRRRGLLDDVLHVKLGRGVLVIRPQDLERVTSFLGEWGASYVVRDIILSSDDQKALLQPKK